MDIILNIFTIFILCISSVPSFVLSSRLRVYGGDTAEPGQFPFMVSVNVKGFGHWSGGSIINENWIVTAAHSMADWYPENLTVLTGTTTLNTGGTSYNASTIIIHSEYNDTIMANDIALLKIDGTFDFNDLVQTVEIGAIFPNDSVTVIGWGSTEEEESPNELHYVTLTALSDEDCTKLSQGGEYVLDRGPGQVCAIGTEGKGGCYGDSGGPLVSNTGALVGIVSYGVKACAKGYPDVYTRVAYYTDWINKHIRRD